MSNDLEEYLVRRATQRGEPIKATLELTPLCNMSCQMCYIRHTSREVAQEGGLKPVSFWKTLIPQMKELGVLFVALIGGEIFTYKGIEELYTELHRSGFYLNFTTNGTMFENGIPSWLTDNKPRYVTVSLYGATDETYEKVTGNAKGFTQTARGIDHLLEAGISTKLNVLVSEESCNDLEKILRFADERKLPVLATPYSFPCGIRNHMNSIQRMSPEKAAQLEIMIRKMTKKKEEYEAWLAFLRMQSEPDSEKNRHFTCRGGKSTFWVSWKGDLSSCGMLDEPSVKIDSSLSKVWKELKEKTQRIILCEECAVCRHRHACSVCAAMMYSETGSFSEKPEYVCRFTHELIRLAENM